MARPRSTDPRQRLTITLPSSALADVRSRAAAEQTTPGVYVGRLVELILKGTAPVPPLPVPGVSRPALTEPPKAAERTVDLLEQECRHPKKARKVFGWGAMCQACGTKVS